MFVITLALAISVIALAVVVACLMKNRTGVAHQQFSNSTISDVWDMCSANTKQLSPMPTVEEYRKALAESAAYKERLAQILAALK